MISKYKISKRKFALMTTSSSDVDFSMTVKMRFYAVLKL